MENARETESVNEGIVNSYQKVFSSLLEDLFIINKRNFQLNSHSVDQIKELFSLRFDLINQDSYERFLKLHKVDYQELSKCLFNSSRPLGLKVLAKCKGEVESIDLETGAVLVGLLQQLCSNINCTFNSINTFKWMLLMSDGATSVSVKCYLMGIEKNEFVKEVINKCIHNCPAGFVEKMELITNSTKGYEIIINIRKMPYKAYALSFKSYTKTLSFKAKSIDKVIKIHGNIFNDKVIINDRAYPFAKGFPFENQEIGIIVNGKVFPADKIYGWDNLIFLYPDEHGQCDQAYSPKFKFFTQIL